MKNILKKTLLVLLLMIVSIGCVSCKENGTNGGIPDVPPSPPPFIPTPVVNVALEGESTLRSSNSTTLRAIVTGTTNPSVTWTIESGSEYATVSDKGVVTAKDVDGDKVITVKCTSVADATKSATKVITIKAKPTLTQDMLDAIKVDKIAFDGFLEIDLYTFGLFETLEKTENTNIRTTMDGTNWFAEYENGNTGTKVQMYFKNHNGIASQVGLSFNNTEDYFPMVDDNGNEVEFKDSGLFNGFKDLTVDDFEFNFSTWTYTYKHKGDKVCQGIISSANPYDFIPTGFDLIIDGGEISGITSIAEPDYRIVQGYKAIQKLTMLISVDDVEVPTITKFEHSEEHDPLNAAIENMKNLSSYTLKYSAYNVAYGVPSEEGFVETITEDFAHFVPFTITTKTNNETVETMRPNDAYGYKRINDNLYNAYFKENNAYTASRAYEQDFKNAKPSFDFAAEIFNTYTIDEKTGDRTYYVAEEMSAVATTFYYGVGNDINLYGIYATKGYFSDINFTPFVVVDANGYIKEACFFYNLTVMYGLVSIEYSNFNSATLPEDEVIEFEAKNVPTLWSELSIIKLAKTESTEDDEIVNALDYLKEFFNDEEIGSKLPFFGDVLGDSYAVGMTSTRFPSGSNTMIRVIAFYYDVPLELNSSVETSIAKVEKFLVEKGFEKNTNGEFEKDGIVIDVVDENLDLFIYVWKK